MFFEPSEPMSYVGKGWNCENGLNLNSWQQKLNSCVVKSGHDCDCSEPATSKALHQHLLLLIKFSVCLFPLCNKSEIAFFSSWMNCLLLFIFPPQSPRSIASLFASFNKSFVFSSWSLLIIGKLKGHMTAIKGLSRSRALNLQSGCDSYPLTRYHRLSMKFDVTAPSY